MERPDSEEHPDAPEAKRIRAQPDTTPLVEGNIWFPGGDLILETNTTKYCVFVEILRLHSPDFRATEAVEPSDDWEILLPMLLGMKGLYAPGATLIDIPEMVAALRLGHKHRFREFADPAISQLRNIFEYHKEFQTAPPVFFEFMDEMRGYEFQILEIIIRHGLQSLLPMAFFMCLCSKTLVDIFERRDEPNGPEVLSDAAALTLRRGAKQLRLRVTELCFGWWSDYDNAPSPNCQDKGGCRSVIEDSLKAVIEVSDALERPTDRFLFDKLCPECRVAEARFYENGMLELMRQLPQCFGLPEWDDLKDNPEVYQH